MAVVQLSVVVWLCVAAVVVLELYASARGMKPTHGCHCLIIIFCKVSCLLIGIVSLEMSVSISIGSATSLWVKLLFWFLCFIGLG